jgi:hypothetical protein
MSEYSYKCAKCGKEVFLSDKEKNVRIERSCDCPKDTGILVDLVANCSGVGGVKQ